ncbi:mannonate dehydratase [Deinococcus hopiensis]|uniref:Mannonate dehydratase n=1 Tax=Deinococcus hopiensis KR-140 TaxID=695939 RepID=A0A1W1UU80_9DEIO|nr:mannonate dehydratase [Deinococcus hopiensis]SMB84708.1 mannonate dehydratase [Deinococcus hopiensis KR-140]
MQMTMRWFGSADPVPLWKLRQVPNLTGIVSALHDVPPGEPWTREGVAALRAQVEAVGLTLRVIESVPVHEDIKLGNARRDERISAFVASLEAVAAEGVPVVCYNFMPVFDWTRTDLATRLPDGSTTLTFRQAHVDGTPGEEPLPLPGWAEAYTPQALSALRMAYAAVGEEQLRANLAFFLRAVVPHAARLGVKLAIHPDDPPWPVLGLPRVVSTAEDLDFLLNAAPDEHNGLTFCTGSLGARADHDLPALARRFAHRIHFVHARNVRRHGQRDFDEVAHISAHGNIDLAQTVTRLAQLRPEVPIRPDHGRMIWGETGRPGYGLNDRALGATYLQGLIDGARLRSHA